jgi:hypothetical protein
MAGRSPRAALLRRAVLALAAAAAIAGCGSSAGTPRIILVTPSPIPGSTAAATPGPTTEPTAGETATPETPPDGTVEATPEDTTTPSDEPSLSPSPEPTPTGSPAPPAAPCTGNADNRAFIAVAAHNLRFDVYCAILPSSWWLQAGEYDVANGGLITIDYKTSSGATINLAEGNICPTTCAAAGSLVGQAKFGDRDATLYTISGTWLLFVGSLGDPEYKMTGKGMTQANFIAWAAALYTVPKS